MADPSPSAASAYNDDTESDSELEVNLRIISPSNDLANFPILRGLTASTTVREVRIMVERELHSRMISIAGMRLIYRGRMVDNDLSTLREVIGSVINETELHTLHLVLREPTIVNPNLPISAAEARARPVDPQLARTPPYAQYAQQIQRSQRPQQLQQPHAYTMPGQPEATGASGRPRQPTEEEIRERVRQNHFGNQAQYSAEDVRAIQRQNYLNQRALVLETIRANSQSTFATTGLAAPARTAPAPHTSQSAQELQPTHSHQTPQAGQVPHEHHLNGVPDAARRESLQNTAEQQHSSQVNHDQQTHHTEQGHPHMFINGHLQQFFTAADNADQHRQAVSGLRHRNVPHQQVSSPTTAQGTLLNRRLEDQDTAVYILQSPDGPRALLINAEGTAFYSSNVSAVPAPAAPTAARVPTPYQTTIPQAARPDTVNIIREHNARFQNQHQNYLDFARQHLHHMELLRNLEQEHLHDPRLNGVQAQDAFQPHQAQPGGNNRHALGQPAGGEIPQFQGNILRVQGHPINNAGFLAAVWPQVWLVARLILFIWWFTHPTASWTRWATVILLAIAVFIVNTGMVDNLATRIWIPIRAHLDNLLQIGNPADENGQAAQAGQDGQAGQVGQQQITGEPAAVAGGTGVAAPNPAAAARRLVERRQLANGERLMNFARSLERFGILFLASLAPGIAERHVQLVEEQERRRQRQIREQEEAAAAAAAAAAEAAAAAAAEAQASGDSDAALGEAESTDPSSEKSSVTADGIAAN